MRATIRVRLAAWCTALTALAGLVLLGVTYVLVVPELPTRAMMTAVVPPGRNAHSNQAGAHLAAVAQVVDVRAQVGHSLLTWGGLALLGVVVLSACVGCLIAGRMLRPVRAVTAAARRVAQRHLHERIALTGPADELKELADTFDSMLERLERSFDGQRRFIANASHELRTPLTTTRALVEVALTASGSSEDTRRLGGKLLTITTAQEQLLDGLLALAHSETTINRDTVVDLADLAAEAAGAHADAALRAGIELRTELAAAPLHGDPALLSRVVHNLVDNAIRYNLPTGGQVTVRSATTREKAATLQVSNSGPVIDADDAATLFVPFRRLRYDRTRQPRGSGLGLSVVRAVIRAHHGSVRAHLHSDGGLTMSIVIPPQPDASATPRSVSKRALPSFS